MEISPRYVGPPIIQLAGDPAAAADPLIRQRTRLERVLGSFTDDEWRAPSRCDGWTAQDVVTHLVSTNQFWAFSLQSGLGGAPSRLLEGFDPKASPAALVDAGRGRSPDETLAAFAESNRVVFDLLRDLDDDAWSTIAEAPPGHVTVGAVAHNALWDSWLHERDILVALGRQPDEEPDEVVACLRFAAALGPAFAVGIGTAGTGSLVLDATDPAATVVVTVSGDAVHVDGGEPGDDALVLRGPAVELLEALSARAPLTQHVPAERAWLVSGIREVFEVPA